MFINSCHCSTLTRFFCGNVRSFDMTISDQTTNEVIRLYRPLTCQGCCCSALYPHCTQVETGSVHMYCPVRCFTEITGIVHLYNISYLLKALTVSVNGETVGTVRERATWWNPVYHVFDSVGNQVRNNRFCTPVQVYCIVQVFRDMEKYSAKMRSVLRRKTLYIRLHVCESVCLCVSLY